MDQLNHLPIADVIDRSNNHLSSVAVFSDDFEPNLNQLVERLQTSLEIDHLLQIFAVEVAKYVDIAAVSFQTAEDSYSSNKLDASFIEYPTELVINNQSLGMLIFSCFERPDDNDIKILDTLKSKIIYPLNNAVTFLNIKRKALNDHLTGLGNRCFFEDHFDKCLARANVKHSDLTLILIDLDNFKQANDNWGHAEGDLILKNFSTLIQKSIRKTDLAFRFGGDEFAILLEGASEQPARRIASNLKKNVNLDPMMNKMGVSASIGYSQLKQGMDKHDLFTLADSALYKAKNAGRNCLRTA
jgi:diguanylate cyclase (GGDEF)-like protein